MIGSIALWCAALSAALICHGCGSPPTPTPPRKPRALALFDVDFTLFGLASSRVGSSRLLYAEEFYDSAFLPEGGKQGYGKVWGLAPGLVPDLTTFEEANTLGPDSILSVSHPLFGADSELDFSFGIVSDGPSLVQFAFSENGNPINQTDQVLAVRSLRSALDFNPRWHILDRALYTCNGQFDEDTCETYPGWRLNPVQQHCACFGNKDRMVQNVLDYYADAGWPKFDFIFFADDQSSNLKVVKEAPHLGGKYTFGAAFRPREEISPDSIFVAYPSGGTSYEVRPRGEASFPNDCGGCYYPTVAGDHVPPFAGDPFSVGNPATDVQPFQAMVAGFGSNNYFSAIATDGTLSGPQPLQSLAASSSSLTVYSV